MTAALMIAALGLPWGPVPRPVAGDALPAGAVARFGPNLFRYGGWVGPHAGGLLVAYSPDGRRVAAAANAGVGVWDAATGRRIGWIPADPGAKVGLFGFHPAGDVIVVCKRSDDTGAGVFRIDPAAGVIRSAWRPADNRAFAAVSPDGRTVYSRVGDNDSTAENVANDLATGRELWRRRHPEMGVLGVSTDGARLLAWSSRVTRPMEVLDAATGRTVATFPQSDDTPPADGAAVTHSRSDGLSAFQAGLGAASRLAGNGRAGTFVRPGGRHAVVTHGQTRDAIIARGRDAYTVEVWDLAAGKLLSAAQTGLKGPAALAPDGQTLAIADEGLARSTLQFVDVATGRRRPPSPEPFTQAAVVWYLPDGTLASADEASARPVAWDAKTGAMTPLPAGTRPPAPAPGPRFNPPAGTDHPTTASPRGDRVLATWTDPDETDGTPGDNYFGLFDAVGGVVARYPRPKGTSGGVAAFAPDGRTFAVARGDGTITHYDASAGKPLGTVRHAGGAASVAISPDGRRLAAACGDGPILVWPLPAP